MNYKFWLTHPNLIVARIKYWMWEQQNPDKPWLCPGTIDFCERHFKGSIQGLEFGSGRSTQWFARLTDRLTSVEHVNDYYQVVEKQLESQGIANVNYLYVPVNHPESEPESQSYDPLPDYVKVLDKFADRQLDFVIVDGRYRTNCIAHSIGKIRNGGYLLVDDVNCWGSLSSIPIPAEWKIADDSTNGLKRCVIWQCPNG